MKGPSKNTREMLNAFYSGQSIWSSLAGRTPSIGFLDEIAASEEHLVIPYLTPMLVHKAREVRQSAARCIGELFQTMPSLDYPQLEQVCRYDWLLSSTFQPWLQLNPTDLSAFLSLPAAGSLVGVASFHNNGYVREEAVEMLSETTDGTEIPFLLLRMNDWVPEIRRLALGAINDRLYPDYAKPFIRHLGLVFRLLSCERGKHAPLVHQLRHMLGSPKALTALLEGISSPDVLTRRECFKLAVELSESGSVNRTELVLANPDPSMRLWFVRKGLPGVTQHELSRCLERLLRDRSGPVRCEALNYLARNFPDEAAAALRDAMFDAHTSVRASAQYWTSRFQPGLNLAQIYREALANSDQQNLKVTILGLGETGQRPDADRLWRYAEAGTISLKKAIRAVAALNREGYAQRFLESLGNAQPGISREAARALKPLAGRFHEPLLTIFRSSPFSHVRLNAFRQLLTLPFWRRGIFLFESIRDSDEQIVEYGLAALGNWVKRSARVALTPSIQEQAELRAALKASLGMLRHDQVLELDFCLRRLAS